MTEEQTGRTAEDQDQPQDAAVGTGGASDQQEKGGFDSPEANKQQQATDSPDRDDDDKPEYEKEREEAQEEMKRIEEDPPEKLEDWPAEGKAKYETFGGSEGGHGYHEGPEEKLGKADVRHREDGSVEVRGEEADDPKEYKGGPIPGGPTDPDTPNLRMDKASPDDVSDVAREAMEEEGDGDGGGGEREESGEREGGG
jgi:hypothetical protein